MAVSRAGKPVAGRRFPTGANYVEALQNPTLCFEDPDLKNGTVQQSPVLGPKAISGNFASVFSVTAPGGQRYALKCFTRDSSTLEARYQAISKQLSGLKQTKLSQPWPVSLEYLPRGVLVAGQWYPTLKMAWVEGTNLITWIDRNIRNTVAVLGIAERFAALTADLEKLGIAHGDLQHGNLLVAADGTLRLVDYDGMYVPAFKGQGATESGHRNYQSPKRTSSDFGPTMDRFSSWVIYLALVAIATDPSIWGQLHDDEGEFLILKEDDFQEPRSSMAWSLLLTHPDPALQALAARTHGLLTANSHAVPHCRQPRQRPCFGPGPTPVLCRSSGRWNPSLAGGPHATASERLCGKSWEFGLSHRHRLCSPAPRRRSLRDLRPGRIGRASRTDRAECAAERLHGRRTTGNSARIRWRPPGRSEFPPRGPDIQGPAAGAPTTGGNFGGPCGGRAEGAPGNRSPGSGQCEPGRTDQPADQRPPSRTT